MSSVLHLTDPHFGTEQPAVVAALERLIAASQPQVVLVGGDITQRARRGQFERAAEFVARLPCPTIAVPGNHDIPLFNVWARVFNPYGNYRRSFGRDLEPSFESPQFLVLGVNTTRPRRHKDGQVSRTQIRRVQRRLMQAQPGQICIVMAHHPVRAKEASDRLNLLHGRQDAVPEWVDGGVDLILGGHIHLPYTLPVQGRTAGGRHAWVVQAGTAVSHRVRGDVPNSVNIIEYVAGSPPECEVQRWDYDVKSDEFRKVTHQRLVLSPRADPVAMPQLTQEPMEDSTL